MRAEAEAGTLLSSLVGVAQQTERESHLDAVVVSECARDAIQELKAEQLTAAEYRYLRCRARYRLRFSYVSHQQQLPTCLRRHPTYKMHHSVNSGQRVLCVDDNEATASVRAAMLEFHGYEASILTDERAVLDFLENQPVDILVLDYLMPEIRGDALATMVRLRYPELPIVLISGAVDEPDDLGGADVFVSKSAGARRLLEVLDEFRKQPRRNVA